MITQHRLIAHLNPSRITHPSLNAHLASYSFTVLYYIFAAVPLQSVPLAILTVITRARLDNMLYDQPTSKCSVAYDKPQFHVLKFQYSRLENRLSLQPDVIVEFRFNGLTHYETGKSDFTTSREKKQLKTCCANFGFKSLNTFTPPLGFRGKRINI